MLIQCGNWPVAVGVDWTMPISDREIRSERKARGKSSWALASVGRQHWLGFHEPIAGQVYAAALLAALVKPNAILFLPVNDEYAWVCAIADAMPVVGYDQLLPLDDARNTAIEWSSTFGKAEMVGPIAGAEGEVSDVLQALDEGLRTKAIRKKQVAAALLKKSGVSVAGVTKLVLVGVTVCAVPFAVIAFKDHQAREANRQSAAASQRATLEEAARRALAEMQSKTMRDADRNAQIKTFSQQVRATQAAYAERSNPTALWRAFAQLRHALPISQGGYKPQTIECSGHQCRVTWQGSGRFTVVADKWLLPNVEHDYSPNLSAASVFPLTVSADALPNTNIETADEMLFRLQSTWSSRVRGFQAEPAQPVTVAAPKELNLPAATAAHVGKWHVRLQGATALIQAGEVMGLATQWPMRVTGLKYMPVTPSIDIDGEYILLARSKD